MQNTHVLLLVIFTSVMGQIATDIYLPSLPSMESILQVDASWLKISISIFLLGYAFSQLICGPISDRIGRKPFMLLGVIIFSAGCYLAIISKHINVLLIARIMQGIGVGTFGVANRAILFDAFKGKSYTKSISIVSMVMAVSPMLAPGFGGLLHTYYGWQSTFIFMLLYAFILFFALLMLLDETLVKQESISSHTKGNSILIFKKLFYGYRVILLSNRFWIFSSINTLGFAAFIFYLGSASFLIQNNLHYTAAEYGRIIGMLAIGYIAGSSCSNYLTEFKTKYEIINIGNLIQLSASLLFLILYITEINLLMLIIFPMSLFVFGTGMINPNATAILVSSHPTAAATAAAAMGVSMTFGTSLITSMLFYFSNGTLMFLACCILIFGLGIRIMILIERHNFSIKQKMISGSFDKELKN